MDNIKQQPTQLISNHPRASQFSKLDLSLTGADSNRNMEATLRTNREYSLYLRTQPRITEKMGQYGIDPH